MNFRQKITLSILLYIVLNSAAFAQVVDIPDANLRAAIREALDIADRPEVTLDASVLRRLRDLNAGGRGISDLTGLEHATSLTFLALHHNDISDLRALTPLVNLTFIRLHDNQINDLRPLSNLTKLTTLLLDRNNITDINPLANLKQLTTLVLDKNNITDIRSLANLTQLTQLKLNSNRITDVSVLSALTSLEILEIHHNLIADHSPINGLSLSHISYDEVCESLPAPVLPRITQRGRPSVFSAWKGVINKPNSEYTENLARHDLWWDHPGVLALNFIDANGQSRVAGPMDDVINTYEALVNRNSNLLILAEIRVKTYYLDRFPEDWPHWIRDAQGNRITAGGRAQIDFVHPDVQEIIIQRVLAVERCGLFDGVFFDHGREDIWYLQGHRSHDEVLAAMENILRRIRAVARPDFLIITNTNGTMIPRTGPYINGAFMETGTLADGPKVMLQLEEALMWTGAHLRNPQVNCLEIRAVPTQPPDSPANLRGMRTATTLSLIHSDGYILFSIGPGTHAHYWYDFWDADLGRPVGEKAQLYQETDGLYIREFTNGWAVYNRSGSKQEITLPEPVAGVASRLEGLSHTLPNLDGEMYLRAKPVNPADVNGDGVVNIFDLTLVAQAFGKDGLEADVNGDGVVNVFDLVFVAGEMQ